MAKVHKPARSAQTAQTAQTAQIEQTNSPLDFDKDAWLDGVTNPSQLDPSAPIGDKGEFVTREEFEAFAAAIWAQINS